MDVGSSGAAVFLVGGMINAIHSRTIRVLLRLAPPLIGMERGHTRSESDLDWGGLESYLVDP